MSGDNAFYLPDADKNLKNLCRSGLKKLFGKQPPETVKKRLTAELKIVAKNGHSSYYLLASMLAKEAERLHHAIFFRGTIGGSLIAYTSGISKINPMESEYGGVDLPFEITREEYEVIPPTLDIQCSIAFIFFAQVFLAREFSEYRYISYPLNSAYGVRAIRLFFIKEESFPSIDPTDIKVANMKEYPDFMFVYDFFHITLIADSKMELVRYNLFYRDGITFDERDAATVIPKIWKYEKKINKNLAGFKRLKVNSYNDLITVLGMAHSTDVWRGLAKKKVLDGSLSLSKMIGTRDDLFKYLVNMGIDKKVAFTIMRRAGVGKHLTKEEESKMRNLGAEEWVIDLCKNARYIFPRAHIAQIIRKDAFCLDRSEGFDENNGIFQYVLENSFQG